MITGNFRDTWRPGSLNQADHMAVGRGILDAVRDAGNRWIFNDQLGSPCSAHAVDITDFLTAGIASLEAHRAYIDGLGWDHFDPSEFLEARAREAGRHFITPFAAPFDVYSLIDVSSRWT